MLVNVPSANIRGCDSGDELSWYQEFYLFSRNLSCSLGWYPLSILCLCGILFLELNYDGSYYEIPVVGEESNPGFSYPCMPISILWPFTGLIHKVTDELLILLISVTW